MMKVSVAMITYNQAAYVAQAIDSVLMQRCDFDFELVIGEDCSTDGTRAIVEDFARRWPDRIRLCTGEANVGAQRNLARVFAACSGLYVALLDGDDYWTTSDKLQRQADYLDARPDCALCFHDVRFVDESGTLSRPALPRLPERSTICDLLSRDNYIASCSVMYRWQLHGPLPAWWNDVWIADLPLHVLHARHGWIGYLDEVMAVYRVHGGGLWSGKPPIARTAGALRTLEVLDQTLGREYHGLIQSRIFAMRYSLAGELLEAGQRDLAAPEVRWCVAHLGARRGISLGRMVALTMLQVAPCLVPAFVRAKRVLRRVVRGTA
jgi:glycosyltransferase involved in cell wall biosynthesis